MNDRFTAWLRSNLEARCRSYLYDAGGQFYVGPLLLVDELLALVVGLVSMERERIGK